MRESINSGRSMRDDSLENADLDSSTLLDKY
jgi:hypothetical protein